MSTDSTIKSFMGADHVRCDAMFEQAQAAAEKGDWAAAREPFGKFYGALEHHIAMEEEILFPAFERATGNTAGPTFVMRLEHKQMRGVAQAMTQALDRQDVAGFLGHADTLQILMGQHNLKEESILYPMTDRALSPSREDLLREMENLPHAAGIGVGPCLT